MCWATWCKSLSVHPREVPVIDRGDPPRALRSPLARNEGASIFAPAAADRPNKEADLAADSVRVSVEAVSIEAVAAISDRTVVPAAVVPVEAVSAAARGDGGER